ncbi:hypothetical protein KEM52_001939 [Ascosphaera acerosa]|nr:hypothetical protein KEM52_001939 [Ascosphaera acerosa]
MASVCSAVPPPPTPCDAVASPACMARQLAERTDLVQAQQQAAEAQAQARRQELTRLVMQAFPLSSDVPLTPTLSSPSSVVSLPQYEPLTRLSHLPKDSLINQGVSASDGCVMINWELSIDGQQLLSPTAVLALALMEAGRAMGAGKITYVPLSIYTLPDDIGEKRFEDTLRIKDLACSAEADYECAREGFTAAPELFYSGAPWEPHEMEAWDNADYLDRLEFVRTIIPEEQVMPVRVLARNRTIGSGVSSKCTCGHSPSDNTASAAQRAPAPHHTSRAQQQTRLHSSTVNRRGAAIASFPFSAADSGLPPRTRTSPALRSNAEWLGSIHEEDNLDVMQRLNMMWENPVDYAFITMDEICSRIAEYRAWFVEVQREIERRQRAPSPPPRATAVTRRPQEALAVQPHPAHQYAAQAAGPAAMPCNGLSVDDEGTVKADEDEDEDADCEVVLDYTLHRCVAVTVPENVRDLHPRGRRAERGIVGDGASESPSGAMDLHARQQLAVEDYLREPALSPRHPWLRHRHWRGWK